MWFCYEKHICERCKKEFEYSEDSVTLSNGVKCTYCGQEYEFSGTHIKMKRGEKK